MNNNITVAIDGNAASGKGTLAKNLATHFNYAYLDTGKLYRASALVIKENRIDYADINKVIELIKSHNFFDINLNDKVLKSDEIGKLASLISGYKEPISFTTSPIKKSNSFLSPFLANSSISFAFTVLIKYLKVERLLK